LNYTKHERISLKAHPELGPRPIKPLASV
jgi:hypothetical protein